MGAHGARLSGGQRQRLAVARALLADFPVLVLDEPAEHLEPAAADALTADLLDVTDGRSLVLITHRLAGLESVDEILVMEHGRVVQRGTHDELLGQAGRYSDLWWEEMRTARDARSPEEPMQHGRPQATTALREVAALNDGSFSLMTTDLARWQFATTSIYHFLFVPVTIGLAFLVALLQTSWYRNDNPTFKRLTKFFGTLLLINVAVGVVTGLVQEFEFGMNWSNYSRFVGNIFGGPLAMEGLAAFFLESTFLGIWIFGWDRLSKKLHLTCIWLVAGASMLSALFIMAANSWMQHPVGYVMNSQHEPQLTDIWALFTNPVFLWAYPHVILASLVTGAIIMLAFSAWHMRRQSSVTAFRRTAIISVAVLAPAVFLNMFIGSELGVVEGKYQPMKIAAAEALWTTCPSHCRVLGLPDRRRAQRRDPDPDHRDPRPAVDPRHQPPRRRGAGDEQPAGAVREGVRAGQLHPQRLHPVLGHAGHGLSGRADRPVRAVGALAHPPQDARQGQVVPPDRSVVRHRPVPHEHGRMAVDGERPPALDRARPVEDVPGGVALGDVDRHLDQPDRLRAHVPRAGGGRRLSDDPLRPSAVGTEPGGSDGDGGGDGGPDAGSGATEESEDDRVPALIY